MKKKPTHGGKRPNSGRKTGYKKPKSELKEKTVVRRIPVSILPSVDKQIKEAKKKWLIESKRVTKKL